MARDEQDREDLMAEATALVERASVRLADRQEPIVVGFRRDGSASFFFSAEPVYQFNSAGKLRRAYADGLLYKAERGRLVALHRERTDRQVGLVRHELNAAETEHFLAGMNRQLNALSEALSEGHFELIGQVPSTVDVLGRIRRWLESFSNGTEVADSPRVG